MISSHRGIWFKIIFPLPHLTILLITHYVLFFKKGKKRTVLWTFDNLLPLFKIKVYDFTSAVAHSQNWLLELLILLNHIITSNTPVHSSIQSVGTVIHTSVHPYTHAYTATYTCLIRLRQSLQLNWAFLKALICPFWPNYHTLIQINQHVSSKYTERAIPKWMLFAFSPFSFLF